MRRLFETWDCKRLPRNRGQEGREEGQGQLLGKHLSQGMGRRQVPGENWDRTLPQELWRKRFLQWKKKKESALACWRDVQSQTLKNDLSDLKCLLVVSAEQWQRTIWGKEFIKKQEFEHVSREVLGFGERVKLVTWFGWYKSPWVSDTSTTRNGRELFLGEHECLKAELLQRPLDLEA